MLAIPWYFIGILHREELFGKSYFFITSMSLFWGVYAGTLIDRYSRKKIFLAMNGAGFLLLSAVSLTGFVNDSLHWFLVASVFATTAFIYNIHFPNLYAFAQEITAKEDYARINSLLEIQGQITFTLAGGIAALLLNGMANNIHLFGTQIFLPFAFKAWEIHEIFAIDAITYLIALIIIYRIKTLPIIEKKVDRERLFARIKTGFSFLKKHPALFYFGNASLFLFLTILIFGTYLQPIFVDSYLHKSGDVYALGDMVFSLGAVIAGFITTRIVAEKNTLSGIIVLLIIAGIMYLWMCSSPLVWVFFIANFVIGSCNAAVRIQRTTYLFHHIPNHIIGRAGSSFFVMNVIMRLLLIAGFSMPLFHRGANIVFAVVILALICFTGSAVLWFQRAKLNSMQPTS